MKTAFINANIITGNLDSEGKLPVKKGTVIVNNGIFEDVIFGEAPELKDCDVRNVEGKYFMPGLINLHVHLSLSGVPMKTSDKPRKKPINYKKLFQIGEKLHLIMAAYRMLQEKNATNLLLGGVTTARTVGGILDFDGIIRDKINKGKLAGPRLLVANTAVSVPGGHFAGSLATEATSPEEAAADVRKIAVTNPDIIKLMITGGIMDATENGVRLHMKPEIVRAACDEAHKLGYKVAAHVESSEGVRVALENGVDTIEHGAPIDDELVELFKEKNAADVCTFSPAVPYAYFDPSVSKATEFSRNLSNRVLFGMRDCAKTCLENGIPVGLGTDAGCPYTTPYNTWRELVHFTRFLDVSPDFAIWTATKNNADIIGIGDKTGTIEKGKSADFIVLSQNPLDDLTALRNIDIVSVEGKIIDNPKPKRSSVVETELDKINYEVTK